MEQTNVSGAPQTYPASPTYRAATAVFVFGPPALLVQALRKRWLMATALNRWIFVVSYLASGFGITIGYHRLLTHKSFRATPRLRQVLAVLGASAVQGSPPDWVADHRKHHNFTDVPGDPHSPHADHKGGLVRGFIHAHTGWLFDKQRASRHRYARDILDDPGLMAVHRQFPQIVAATYLVPFAAGVAGTRSLRGGLSALLWGGALRVFFVHHATWSVNSICHLYGEQPFATGDQSRNNLLVALVALGEGNHNSHHAFPSSAKHGLSGAGEWLDLSWWVIRALERAGWATEVRRIEPDRVEEKRLMPDPVPA